MDLFLDFSLDGPVREKALVVIAGREGREMGGLEVEELDDFLGRLVEVCRMRRGKKANEPGMVKLLRRNRRSALRHVQ